MTDISQLVPDSPEYDAAMIAAAGTSRVRYGDALSGASTEIVPEAPTTEQTEQNADVTTTTTTEPAKEPAKPDDRVAALEAQIAALTAKLNPQQAAVEPATTTVENYLEAPRAALVTAQQKLAGATDDAAKAAAQTEVDAALKALLEAKAPEKKPDAAPAIKPEDVRTRATEELNRDGKLSDQTYADAAKFGWDKDTVDAYVEGLKARSEVIEMRVYQEAGGKDQFTAMSAWAKANWSDAQRAAYNSAIDSGDMQKTLGALKTLKDAYTNSNGSDATTRVTPSGGAASVTNAGYTSKAEFQKDVSDPRYQKGDRAFHAEVDRKLEAAMRAGVDLGF